MEKKVRYCKGCGVEIGKSQQRCNPCRLIRREEIQQLRYHKQRLKQGCCNWDGCNNERVFRQRYCSEHSVKTRHHNHKNGMKKCQECGIDIGIRKDNLYKKRCDECEIIIKEKRRIRDKEYRRNYYNHRYHNDNEYRMKHSMWMKKYNDRVRKQKDT